MVTLLVAIGSFFGFIVAYNTYGRWLANKVFGVDRQAIVPSHQLRDDIDFAPTQRQVVFGHHFTSIAGTGPIVGPAIAVFWGWLPALLWVVFGSIFIGAVHDFGALMVSLRNRGQTVGEVAGRLISPRTRILFLLILFFALTVVLAVFGLVIASIFRLYPESVLSVWIALPLAVIVGYWVYRHRGGLIVPSLAALVILYGAIYFGAYHWPVVLPDSWCQSLVTSVGLDASWGTPVVLWTLVLFVYCFAASVLPVWMLLQPRDFINSQQLLVALLLLMIGITVAGITGQADLAQSAPAIVPAAERPFDAPPIWPFLFITIACGAISGFHCLVSSGTSSKQVDNEGDAQYVAYGSMLLEGMLAVIVILACCAGVGMGVFRREVQETGTASSLVQPYEYVAETGADGEALVGRAAWESIYDVRSGWSNFRLATCIRAFVDGGANFLAAIGIPLKYGVATIAVLVACFAMTTIDTATRLQRYVIEELAGALHVSAFQNKYAATALAVGLALALALMRGPSTATGELAARGTGGNILWPLFGATNQLLAGLAFLVTAFYLLRRNKPIWFLIPPMILMIIMPVWALAWMMFNPETGWWQAKNYLLFGIGAAVMLLQIWMVIEAILMWPRAKGVLEQSLPPLKKTGVAGG